jgi:hypothetical protein
MKKSAMPVVRSKAQRKALSSKDLVATMRAMNMTDEAIKVALLEYRAKTTKAKVK